MIKLNVPYAIGLVITNRLAELKAIFEQKRGCQVLEPYPLRVFTLFTEIAYYVDTLVGMGEIDVVDKALDEIFEALSHAVEISVGSKLDPTVLYELERVILSKFNTTEEELRTIFPEQYKSEQPSTDE